nr:MAG TPA: hypothetical protein [Caudoviricetes sp.]
MLNLGYFFNLASNRKLFFMKGNLYGYGFFHV